MTTPWVDGPGMRARDEVLARLRAALADRPGDVAVPRDYRRGAPPGTEPTDVGLLERLAERLADYRAQVRRCDESGIATTVASALRERGARRVVVPRDVPDRWLSEVDTQVLSDDGRLSTAELDAVDGVLTGCAVAVAETGTLVLDGGPTQGRRAPTLLPDYHLCVVLPGQLVWSVPEALARLRPDRPLTWISGPSATSDIELNRVEGVHGPRTLEVVIVEPG